MFRAFWTASAVLLFCVAAFAETDRSVYKITVDPEAGEMRVSAELTLEDPELRIAEIGADQFPRRWAEFIKNVSAKDRSGDEIGVHETAAGWRVDAKKGESIRLTYTVGLDHEKHEWSAGIDGALYVREWGVFSVGRAFALTNGTNAKPIEIVFEVPDGWSVTGSWKKLDEDRFLADGNDDLTESMFFAGTHREFTIDREGFELQFAFGGPDAGSQEKRFSSLATKVLDYYTDLMGGLPKPPPGVDFGKVLVIINPGASTDGEVIGKHISMILDSSGDPMGEMFSTLIFAHEFFHLWNGKSLVPESAGEEWFKEGVSNYYTIKALRAAGALPENAMFAVMNGLFFQRYSNDEAYGKRPISEVSSGDDKHKHWGMIYGGGLFAGICRDVAIRKATKNAESLDTLMRGLYKDYAGTEKVYSRKELLGRFEGLLNGSDGFFDSHVYGPAKVPIAECLSDAGLDARIANGQLVIKRKVSETGSEKETLEAMLGIH